jgi:hypothetical protein
MIKYRVSILQHNKRKNRGKPLETYFDDLKKARKHLADCVEKDMSNLHTHRNVKNLSIQPTTFDVTIKFDWVHNDDRFNLTREYYLEEIKVNRFRIEGSKEE